MGKYHVVKVREGYRLCESFDALSLDAAKRIALRLHVSKPEYRNAHCPMVLRDGNTGARFSMRECADSVPSLPWYWWCPDAQALPAVIAAIDGVGAQQAAA